MSKYLMPATRMSKSLGEWLTVAMNDHVTVQKALDTKEEGAHKSALLVCHSYLFAIKSAHDALFTKEELRKEIDEALDTPEKRVHYYASKLLGELEAQKMKEANVKTTQLKLC